jgi:thiazole synthase ThiGH ThiG subunit
MWDESRCWGRRSFRSRLIVGAGAIPPRRSCGGAGAAGAELVTIAVRDLDLASAGGSSSVDRPER